MAYMNPKTNPDTKKTASTPAGLEAMGNDGNTKRTRLPKGGCPKGAKKKSSRGSRMY